MNTSEFIPFDSVAPILLESSAHPDWPFFSGTGFFVHFPPFNDIFFVTAMHCVRSPKNEELGNLKIKYHHNQVGNDVVQFEEYLLVADAAGKELEDVAIYVARDLGNEKTELLRKRALRLQHQEDAAALIDAIVQARQKVRTVGFPGVSKEIKYDEAVAVVQPRGFHGILEDSAGVVNHYKISEINWKDGELDGFSGAPIIAFCPNLSGQVNVIPIGVLITGSAKAAKFLSINVVTDSIACYLVGKYRIPEG